MQLFEVGEDDAKRKTGIDDVVKRSHDLVLSAHIYTPASG